MSREDELFDKRVASLGQFVLDKECLDQVLFLKHLGCIGQLDQVFGLIQVELTEAGHVLAQRRGQLPLELLRSLFQLKDVLGVNRWFEKFELLEFSG